MYCILDESIALRSWIDKKYTYIQKGNDFRKELTEEEFLRLFMADGKTQMPEDDLQQQLLEKKLMTRCNKGEKQLCEWQVPRLILNFNMPLLCLQLTGKCNYNCLHCFNAVDNAPLQSELSFDEIIKILDDAVECGVRSLELTGGEPLIRKDFREIIKAIYDRGLYLIDIVTNASKLTEELLDFLLKYFPEIKFKISFDGIGYHDWMRGVKGAEKETLEALRLCKKKGVRILVHVNMNKKNLDAIPETLDLLDSIGVDACKVIRTAESPRWLENCGDSALSIGESFEADVRIAQEYIKKPHKMILVFFEYMEIYPFEKVYNFNRATNYNENGFDPKAPICTTCLSRMAIDSRGFVYPCLQMSGALEAKGKKFENVLTDDMGQILRNSEYLDMILKTVGDRIEQCEKCRNCRYLKVCGGGCPILAMVVPETDGSLLGYDPLRCYFYENRIDRKFKEVLQGYKDMSWFDLDKVVESEQ